MYLDKDFSEELLQERVWTDTGGELIISITNIFDIFCFLSRKTTLIAHIFNFYFFRIILRKIKDLIGKDKTEFET